MPYALQDEASRDAGDVTIDVLTEDGRVRDCVTGARRGTGRTGAIRTAELGYVGQEMMVLVHYATENVFC